MQISMKCKKTQNLSMTQNKNKKLVKNLRNLPSPAFPLPANEPKGEAVLESWSNSAATAISAAIVGPRPSLFPL
jgi:hypothetical protein